MAVVTTVPEPNLWTEICDDFESRRPPYKDAELESVNTEIYDYDPRKHSPIFYGAMHEKVNATDDNFEVDAAVGHPAALGHAFVERPEKPRAPSPPPPPPYDTCPPRDYLEAYIFPTLLPAIEEMLKHAKTERCFERKRTRFNALDFLTEYLYNHNPASDDRDQEATFLDIDFVKEYLEKYPRAPLPLSLLWTEEEATLVIQSHWRGYLVRREPEVQELRQWQKMWKEENANVNEKVSDFWANKMPCEGSEQSDDVNAEIGDVTEPNNDVTSRDDDVEIKEHSSLKADSPVSDDVAVKRVASA